MSEDLDLEKELFNRARKHPEEFPESRAAHYVGKYKALRTTFEKDYQQYIDAAMVLKEGILYTSHGKDHFRTVINRADKLIHGDPVRLLGYEIYVLLIAIHLHDVGNLFGRRRHEKECKKIIDQLGALLSDDAFEKRLFYDVAMAHGGLVNNDKDTIRTLRPKTLFHNQPVHLRKLAAILRLADELADDYSRVSGALVDSGIADTVFHFYAKGLQSVEVQPGHSRVELHFSFPKELLLTPQKKSRNETVWLFDEVLRRCLKTFLEMKYTSQYMRTINVDELYVHVEWHKGEFDSPIEEVSFTFESLGFPEANNIDIYRLVPILREYTSIGKLTGKSLCKHLRQRDKSTSKPRNVLKPPKTSRMKGGRTR